MDEKPKRGQTPDRNTSTLAVILIAVGVIFLLANAGILAGIGRLWPLILVGIGAWLLFGKTTPTLNVKRERFTAPVDNARAARVKLNFSVGETEVTSSASPDLLIDANLVYMGDIQFVNRGEEEKFISLSQSGDFAVQWLNPANWFNAPKRLRWDVGLNPTVPMSLDVHGGLGEARLDLSRLNLTALDATNGVGEMRMTLPVTAEPLQVRVQAGLGRVELTVLDGAAVHAQIKGGVGECVVNVPPRAAVRVSGKAGIGDINVGGRLQHVSGGQGEFALGKSGVWETPDFAQAERQIIIEFEGGVGELRVR